MKKLSQENTNFLDKFSDLESTPSVDLKLKIEKNLIKVLKSPHFTFY